jgi:carboxypeptidase C (cathepsin A)
VPAPEREGLATRGRTAPYPGATPYYAAQETFAHLDVPAEVLANIEHAYYAAGHMMYVHEPSRLQQSKDLAAFIRGASAQ